MDGLANISNRITGLILISLLFCCCDGTDKGFRSGNSKKRGVISQPGIYVNAKSGDDRNPGTVRKPVRSVEEATKRIRERAGDIFFAGGQSFEGTLMLRNLQGDAEDTLVIGSYGAGIAEIDGGSGEAIRIEDCRFIRIQNLYLTGDGRKDGNTENGLLISNSSDCVVENIIAEGFRESGVELYDCRNVRVLKVTALYNGFCGINVRGSDMQRSGNILIKECSAENNPGDPAILDNHSGNGILIGVSDSVTVDHCTATDNGWDMPRRGNGPVGIWTWESDHVTIQYCISYRNKTSEGGKDGGGFDLDGGVRNSMIQYCLSYENQGAGYGLFQYPGASDWSENVIRYCVSINDARTTEGSGSIFIWNGTGKAGQLVNCDIYNNVVYNSSAPVISFENASDHLNFNFFNNIFLGSGELVSGINKGSRFLGNVWWSRSGKLRIMEYGSLKSWADETGQETFNGKIAGIETDPGLTGPFITDITDPYRLDELYGYTLGPGSSLRGKGIDLKTHFGVETPEKDFFGNPLPRGNAPEPGINEID